VYDEEAFFRRNSPLDACSGNGRHYKCIGCELSARNKEKAVDLVLAVLAFLASRTRIRNLSPVVSELSFRERMEREFQISTNGP
jgi:hypothetical protein